MGRTTTRRLEQAAFGDNSTGLDSAERAKRASVDRGCASRGGAFNFKPAAAPARNESPRYYSGWSRKSRADISSRSAAGRRDRGRAARLNIICRDRAALIPRISDIYTCQLCPRHVGYSSGHAGDECPSGILRRFQRLALFLPPRVDSRRYASVSRLSRIYYVNDIHVS